MFSARFGNDPDSDSDSGTAVPSVSTERPSSEESWRSFEEDPPALLDPLETPAPPEETPNEPPPDPVPESPIMVGEEMDVEKKTSNHAKKPTPFSGDRKKLQKFLLNCEIYLAANEKDFSTGKS